MARPAAARLAWTVISLVEHRDLLLALWLPPDRLQVITRTCATELRYDARPNISALARKPLARWPAVALPPAISTFPLGSAAATAHWRGVVIDADEALKRPVRGSNTSASDCGTKLAFPPPAINTSPPRRRAATAP